MPTPIIWPLRNKLKLPVFNQQYYRSQGNLLPVKLPVNFPWNVASARYGIKDVPQTQYPSVVHPLAPIINQFKIAGVTKDSSGNALGGCTVKAYRQSDDSCAASTTSDNNGNYVLMLASSVEYYYLRFYLAGSPDRAGTTQNGLTVF